MVRILEVLTNYETMARAIRCLLQTLMNFPSFRPQLCHRYAEHRHKMPYPCYMQPKLNGIRMVYNNGVLMSRSHGLDEPKLFHPNRLQHIRKALANFPEHMVFDGELYIHGQSLQKINGLASVNSCTPRPGEQTLQYHIFDAFDFRTPEIAFEERISEEVYSMIYDVFNVIQLVQTAWISEEAMGEIQFAEYKDQGYEGAIYRNPSAPYGLSENCGNKENRWAHVLKRKDFLDAEFEIIGVQEGEGKYDGMVGAFLFEMPNGKEFSAGSGLSDMERHKYWSSPPIGHTATVKYEMLSDEGVPLKPTIVEVQ